MILNKDNYYSDEMNMAYMSVSQYKDFVGTYARAGCEYGALKKLKGEWKDDEKSTALLVGSYVDSYFEGTLEKFKEEESSIFTKTGSLRSQYKKADELIKRAESDEYFMKYLDGEKQVIMTGDIEGIEWKIKMDSYLENIAIVDLKVVASLTDLKWVKGKGYLDFIRYWGYDIQGAVYQEIVYQNTGKRLPFYIAGISKESEPDLNIIQITQNYLDESLDIVRENVKRIYDIKREMVSPKKCNVCDVCKHFKTLKAPIGIADLTANI